MFRHIYLKSFILSLFCCLFVFASCKKEVPLSDKHFCRLFLEHVMIREGGLYTLLGSKPMTEFEICEGFPETHEEQKSDYQEYLTCLEKEKIKIERPSFEEYVAQRKKNVHLNFRKLWKFWKAYQPECLGDKYFILSIKEASGEEGMGLFINIPNTVYILTKYQTIFEKETRIPFDPNTVIKEIPNPSSEFWAKAFNSSYLFGLLMGYGERNSLIWTWCNSYNKEAIIQFAFYGHPSSQAKVRTYLNNHLKVSDLLLPTYASFSIYDDTLERYCKEREAIIKFFEKRDFVEGVLKVLSISEDHRN